MHNVATPPSEHKIHLLHRATWSTYLALLPHFPSPDSPLEKTDRLLKDMAPTGTSSSVIKKGSNVGFVQPTY
ncbi:MAG: hypothetical protein ACK53Y_00045, partial [bacterium]